MTFGTADRRKADVAEGVALAVGHLATQRGNRLGVVTFGGGSDRRLPPTAGRQGLLASLVAARAAGDAALPPSTPLRRRRRRHARRGAQLRRRAFAPRGGLRRPRLRLPRPARLAGAARRGVDQHHVLVVEIRDPREDELPDVGDLTLVDGETGREVRVDTSSRQLRERFADAAADERAGARDRRCAGSASITSSCRPRATGCDRSRPACASSGGPHDLRQSRAPARPPDRAARADRLPARPAAPLPLRGPVHQRGPARQPRAAHAELAAPPPARALPRRDRRAGDRPRPAVDGPGRAARGGDDHAHDGRLALDAGDRRRSEPPGRRPGGRDRLRGPAPRAVPRRPRRLLDRCAARRPADHRPRPRSTRRSPRCGRTAARPWATPSRCRSRRPASNRPRPRRRPDPSAAPDASARRMPRPRRMPSARPDASASPDADEPPLVATVAALRRRQLDGHAGADRGRPARRRRSACRSTRSRSAPRTAWSRCRTCSAWPSRCPVPPDTETLAKVAEMTGGRFFEAPTAEDLAAIYESLGSQGRLRRGGAGGDAAVRRCGPAARARRRRPRRPLVQPLPVSRGRRQPVRNARFG